MKTPKKIISKTGHHGNANKGEKVGPEKEKPKSFYDDEEEEEFELDGLERIDDLDDFDEEEDY